MTIKNHMEERKTEPRRIFMGGLIDGVNCKFKEDGSIDLNESRDLIVVDRKYFLKSNALIAAWAQHVDESKKD